MAKTLTSPGRLASALVMVAFALQSGLWAQTPPTDTPPRAFEVASVKPDNKGGTNYTEDHSHGRFTSTNTTALGLIRTAFGVVDAQILGLPGWVAGERYDIIAKTDVSHDLEDKELQPYVQSLLADRFQFRYHRETREMQVLSLVIAKSGSKLKVHTGEGHPFSNLSFSGGKGNLAGAMVPLSHLIDALGAASGRIIVDNTGLTGDFDYNLEWSLNPNADSGTPLQIALQDQLGLRIEAAKSPISVIVIDHLEKPSEN